jgi:hypothetical protein
MASRGASRTGGAGGGGGGEWQPGGSLGGLPCRCHVPQCMPTLHEGQGEGKARDGDGGTHLLTSGSSNKHHPRAVSRAQARPPLAPSAVARKKKEMQSQAASRSAFAVHSYHAHSVPIILFTAVIDRGRLARSSEVYRREVTASGKPGPCRPTAGLSTPRSRHSLCIQKQQQWTREGQLSGREDR